MRHPTIIKIVSSITLLVVFLLVPLTSHADMLGALRKLERDSQRREQRIRRHTLDSHLLNPKNRSLQRLRRNLPAFWQELKSAYQNHVPEFRKLSHRQAHQKQHGRSRPPKTPERILNKFVTRLQHSAVMHDTPTVQHGSEEQAVCSVVWRVLEQPSFLHQQKSPAFQTVPSLYTLSSLRL